MNNYLRIFDNNISKARSLSTIYINLRDNVGIEDDYNSNSLVSR